MGKFNNIKDSIKGFFYRKDGKMDTNKNMWFEREISKTRYKDRVNRVISIDEYLRREHKVLARPDFEFKEHTYETAKIVLQTLKSIIKFHSSFICGNKISITGDKEFTRYLNGIYRKGGYSKTDLQVAKDLITYADAFEYVYMDENDNIKSKIIRNKDSYPIIDSNGNYTHFVEAWKDEDTSTKNYVVYYPDRVEIYENSKLVDTKTNLTGLPIWYTSMDKSRYDAWGDPFILDLIPLMDSIESLLSKLDDAVTKLSMEPLGVCSGARLDSSIPENIVGAVLNLEEGATFSFANAMMDRESIKLELDYLIQQFYAVACIPSTLLGSSNIANCSENTITLLYQQTSNFCQQYMTMMEEGFMKRMEYIRKLMELKGETVSDEVFDSIGFVFNVARPIDNEATMKNLQIQRECGAISKQSIIDLSPYTSDTAIELQRLKDEQDAEDKKQPKPTTPAEDIDAGEVVDTKNEDVKIDDKAD